MQKHQLLAYQNFEVFQEVAAPTFSRKITSKEY